MSMNTNNIGIYDIIFIKNYVFLSGLIDEAGLVFISQIMTQ